MKTRIILILIANRFMLFITDILKLFKCRKLISIIYKHVLEVPCMVYKIDMDYKNKINLGEFQEVYDYIKCNIDK